MAASKGFRLFGLAMIAWLLFAAPSAEAAVTCGTVIGAISPCLSYLTAKAAKPPPPCCNGVKRLNALAKTTADRRAGCACLKSNAGKVKGLVASRVSALPGICGVSVPFPISTTINCNT